MDRAGTRARRHQRERRLRRGQERAGPQRGACPPARGDAEERGRDRRSSNGEVVEPGCLVELRYDGDDDVVTYLVGSIEERNETYDVLSTESPLGQALLGEAGGRCGDLQGPQTRALGHRRRVTSPGLSALQPPPPGVRRASTSPARRRSVTLSASGIARRVVSAGEQPILAGRAGCAAAHAPRRRDAPLGDERDRHFLDYLDLAFDAVAALGDPGSVADSHPARPATMGTRARTWRTTCRWSDDQLVD